MIYNMTMIGEILSIKNTHSDGRKYHMQYGSDLPGIGQD